jgi:hypothetical protein
MVRVPGRRRSLGPHALELGLMLHRSARHLGGVFGAGRVQLACKPVRLRAHGSELVSQHVRPRPPRDALFRRLLLARLEKLDGDARSDGQLASREVDGIALPRECRRPVLPVLDRPWLVVEHREQPAALAVYLYIKARPHEAAAAHAEPAADDLEPVGRRPLDALYLEGNPGRRALAGISDR